MYNELCQRYKIVSEEQMLKHKAENEQILKVKRKEMQLDIEFTKKLQSMEHDSLDDELPTRRQPKY